MAIAFKKFSLPTHWVLLALIFSAAFLSCSASSSSSGKRIDLGDISMYVEDYGKGQPIIFLHGGLGSANSWAYQVPVFAKEYRVITPESRGQARTTDANLPITYHLMAEDIIRLMDKLNIPAAYIVGWSDGGNIGIDVALNHPSRVKAVVAYGANINPAGLQNHFLDYLRTASPAKMQSDNGSDYLALAPNPKNLPIIAEKIRTMWLTEPNFTPTQLAKITVPALIMDGQQEELIRPDHAAEIAAAIPKAKLVMLPNVGHYAVFKTPELWNKTVMEFLKAN
jgi:pimeloyl-ACP methyl ester carboxylesterase